MQQIERAQFVKRARPRSIVDQIAMGPVGPPTWGELVGICERELKPGRRVVSAVRRTERPGRDATRPEIEVFLAHFLEFGAARIPQSTIEPVVRRLCRMLGWRKFLGKARDLARAIQPSAMKTRGATSRRERAQIEAWVLGMKTKCDGLQNELDAEICDFAN